MDDMVDRSSDHISVTVQRPRKSFVSRIFIKWRTDIREAYDLCGLHDLWAVHLLKQISMKPMIGHLFMISYAALKQGSLVAFPTILLSLSSFVISLSLSSSSLASSSLSWSSSRYRIRRIVSLLLHTSLIYWFQQSWLIIVTHFSLVLVRETCTNCK